MSAPLTIGTQAPNFELVSLNGDRISLDGMRGKIVLLNFWSAECPWSERADRLLAERFAAWGGRVVWVSIAANANELPDLLSQASLERGLPLVLIDSQQQVTDAYVVQTTPHLFVVDASGILRYQGGFDDINFRKRIPERFYAIEAVDALLAGRLPEVAEAPSFGCAITRFAPEDLATEDTE